MTVYSIMEEPHSLVNSAMQQQQQPPVGQENISEKHDLSDEWCFWAHLPHDTDWSLNSYKVIYNLTTAEDTIALNEALPSGLVNNCMLFVMRKGITPLWEDPKNRGGIFCRILHIQHLNIWRIPSKIFVF